MRKVMIGGALATLALLATFGVAACSSNGLPSSAGSGNGSSTTPAATGSISPEASTSPKANAAPSPTGGPSFVPMQTGQGGEFVSPSGNISCEVDYNPNGNKVAYCETGTPAQSVTMSTTGSYITCTGQQCLSNPAMGTPTLAYGTETGVGPFVCESATSGITCTANGRGFRISRSGITPA